VGIILLAALRFSSENFRSWARDMFAPVLSLASKVRYFFADIGGSKISELESKNAELMRENSSFKEKILGFEAGAINTENIQYIPKYSSLILSQAPSTPYDVLLINLDPGWDAKVGMKAIARGGIYIGQISEMGTRSAMIKLLSYPASETEAWLERAGINITLVGEGGYNLKFSLPKDVQVEVGDRILSNTSPQFVVGEVEKINEKPTNPLKEVMLRFPINFKNLRYVELVD